MKNA